MTAIDERRELFLRGIEAYQSARYAQAREHWEALWREEPVVERSRLLQALIFLASAAHRATAGGAPGGAVVLLAEALARLGELPACCLGLNLAALKDDCAPFREALHASAVAAPPAVLDPTLVPPLTLLGEVGPWGALEVAAVIPEATRTAWFEEGLEAYRSGAFFDAHEVWEKLWRDEGDPDAKQLLQGLIQTAAAMHKVQVQHQPSPATSLLTRALLRLAVLPADYGGLQLERLVRELRRTQEALGALTESGVARPSLDPASVPAIERILH